MRQSIFLVRGVRFRSRGCGGGLFGRFPAGRALRPVGAVAVVAIVTVHLFLLFHFANQPAALVGVVLHSVLVEPDSQKAHNALVPAKRKLYLGDHLPVVRFKLNTKIDP